MAGITFSGLASGIDADAIIKTLIEGKRLTAAPLETKVANANKESTALEEFNTKLLTLNDSFKDFLTLAGGAVSKTATSSNEDAVSVSAGGTAIASTTTFSVNRMAKPATASFLGTYNDASAVVAPGLSAATSMQIKVGVEPNAETFSVEVGPETSIDGLVTAINNASENGRVRASLVNVGSGTVPQYRMIVTTTRTGVEPGSLEITTSPELDAQGVLQVDTLQQAQDAEIHLDSIGNVTRASNTISDLIPGLTINIKTENTGPVIISVGNDADKTAKKLNDAVTAFNELVKYSTENSKIERDPSRKTNNNVYGSLARTKVDSRAIDSIRRALERSNSGVDGSKVRIFSDLGITTEKDGTLKFDIDKFTESVAKDPVAVDKLIHGFADKIASTNGIIADYTKYKGTIDIATESNQSEIDGINAKLSRMEENLERQSKSLRLMFSRLESKTAQMNSSADALTSLFNNNKR